MPLVQNVTLTDDLLAQVEHLEQRLDAALTFLDAMAYTMERTSFQLDPEVFASWTAKAVQERPAMRDEVMRLFNEGLDLDIPPEVTGEQLFPRD